MINHHSVYIIAAVDEQFGIGKDNDLAWRLRKELAHFTKTTTTTQDPHKKNMVIMGRSTWESLPEKFRPLPDRMNVVLTRSSVDTQSTVPTAEYYGAQLVNSLDAAFALADDTIETLFVIGGASIYAHAISHPAVDGIYLTQIHHTFDCDVFFPRLPPVFSHRTLLGSEEEKNVQFDYVLFERSL
jgi:dihydrofolate reductase